MILTRSSGKSLRQISSTGFNLLTRTLTLSTIIPKLRVIKRTQHTNATKVVPSQQEKPNERETTSNDTGKTELERFTSVYLKLLEHNSYGDTATAVNLYEVLQNKYVHLLELKHYNAIIASFAPRKLMFGWFRPYKDYVDMYHECAKYRPQERIDEARQVFMDMRERGIQPNTLSYNALMKVQLSVGHPELVRIFETFNDMVTVVDPDIASYSILLRACAILENVELAEEIYLAGLTWSKENAGRPATHRSTSNNTITVQYFNAMLDVYAESRSPMAFQFFDQMISKGLPVDGITFNTYAKACIFMDQRIKLVTLAELMRVEGILQRELSSPVRQEIKRAFEIHTTQESLKNRNIESQYFMEMKKGVNDTLHGDFFEDLAKAAPWGRFVDESDYHFMKVLEDTTIKKFRIDYDKWQNSYTPYGLTESQTRGDAADFKPYDLYLEKEVEEVE